MLYVMLHVLYLYIHDDIINVSYISRYILLSRGVRV